MKASIRSTYSERVEQEKDLRTDFVFALRMNCLRLMPPTRKDDRA